MQTSARRLSGNLPAQPGPLVGRDADIALTLERLRQPDIRLVSLVGTAGAGKTRLGIEVAARATSQFSDGVYFVDLAPITDPALVPRAIGRSLDIRSQRETPLFEVLVDQLSTRSALLLLDNFEQILPAAALLAELLQACPKLKLLVTSRSALRLRWENVMRVPPLAVPDLGALPLPERLAEVASVTLFVQRAQRVEPNFKLTPQNGRTVAEVCVRLDGLPLAIELAAARVQVLPPGALLKRLGQRLDLLATSSQDQPVRQRTLRAAIDASYELLSGAEQALFRRLAVFVGGFSLSAVPEVCDPDGRLGVDPLTGIESLADKSLVRKDEAGPADEPRFALLETIREYALERLAESGERDLTRRRHAAYYLGEGDTASADMKSNQQALWLQQLEPEHDNMLAALTWCREAREPALGFRAAGLLAWFWGVMGYVQEGRQQLTALLELGGAERTAIRAETLRVTGTLALQQGDYVGARELFQASLAMYRDLGDRAGTSRALSGFGTTALQLRDYISAETRLREALAIQEELQDAVGMAHSLNSLANVAHEQGDLVRARVLYERSLEAVNEVRYRPDVVLHNLGILAQEQGDLQAARKYLEDSVAIKRAVRDTPGLALTLAKLGEVVAEAGNLAAGHRLLSESLMLQRDLGGRPGIAFVLERFAIAAARHAQADRALRLAGAARALRESISTPLNSEAQAYLDEMLRPARDTLGGALAARAWEEGHGWPLDRAISAALEGSTTASDRHTTDASSRLSPREREVAVLVAQGLTNREIAERLVVTERTAENHVQRVLNRLGMRSRTQVAAWAVQHGLVTPD